MNGNRAGRPGLLFMAKLSTMSNTAIVPLREKIIQFIWQHIWLLISLDIMTLGIAFCVRSYLGSSVISSMPLAFSLAGAEDMVPALTIGQYTNLMNVVLVLAQIAVLRRRFEPVQLFQIVAGFLFGILIDFNMWLTSPFEFNTLPYQILAQAAGCTILAFGIAMEVRCGSVTMPGEGIQVAVCRVTGMPFAKVKIMIDCTLVALAVVSSYIFWGEWQWNIVGPGTLFAMFYVGWMVKQFSRRIGWFDRVLGYRPGFRRYVYGLARFLHIRH